MIFALTAIFFVPEIRSAISYLFIWVILGLAGMGCVLFIIFFPSKKIADILNKPIPSLRIPVFPVWFAGLLCEIVCKPFGIKPPLYRRRVDFFVKDRAFDISKAKKLLGYNPQVTLEEGINKTANWYKEKGFFK